MLRHRAGSRLHVLLECLSETVARNAASAGLDILVADAPRLAVQHRAESAVRGKRLGEFGDEPSVPHAILTSY
jgi:hypothetical protein